VGIRAPSHRSVSKINFFRNLAIRPFLSSSVMGVPPLIACVSIAGQRPPRAICLPQWNVIASNKEDTSAAGIFCAVVVRFFSAAVNKAKTT
jgi:hypothetical protein